jgi:hypothetical protein
LAKLAESRSSVAGARRDDLWLERDCRLASHIAGSTWEPGSARPQFRSCRGFCGKMAAVLSRLRIDASAMGSRILIAT